MIQGILKRLAASFRNISIAGRSKNLRGLGQGTGQRPNSLRALLTMTFLAFLGAAFAIVMQAIQPPPSEPTLQKDAAELASLERQSEGDDLHTEGRGVPIREQPPWPAYRFGAPERQVAEAGRHRYIR